MAIFTKQNSAYLEKRRHLRINMTPEERTLWYYLKHQQTGYKWRRQYSVDNYIVDFACIQQRLIIEIDGGDHLMKQEYDAVRQEYIQSLGWCVLRFGNNEVREQLESVVSRIYELLYQLYDQTPPQSSPLLGEEPRTPKPEI